MKKTLLAIALLFSFPFTSYAASIEYPSCPLPGEESILISEEVIKDRVQELAAEINRDYAGKNLHIVGILKGSVCFVADFIRELEIPFEIHFITASSYRGGTTSGELTLSGFEKLSLEGKDILLLDDVYDSGQTLTKVVEKMQTQTPRSIRSLLLLQKNVPHVSSIRPDYVGFHIGEEFVIGYGLDYDELYRGLKGIYVIAQ